MFLAMGPPDVFGVYLGSLDGRTPTRLTPGDPSAPAFLPDSGRRVGSSPGDGWLLWVRQGALVAQRLALAGSILTGEPAILADAVAAASASATGLVAYRTSAEVRSTLTWFERSGSASGVIDTEGRPSHPHVSADGRRVAVAVGGDALITATPLAIQGRQYALAPDGRFLINTVTGEAPTPPITLIQNWIPPDRR